MSHTPEPWKQPIEIPASKYEDVHYRVPFVGDFFEIEMAQRAVAEHNACAGMENPAEEIQRMRVRIAELEAILNQRIGGFNAGDLEAIAKKEGLTLKKL